MSVNDPIADLLTRIRNAKMAKHLFVDIPASKMLLSIVEILKNEGFISSFLHRKDTRQGVIRVFLKYHRRESVIRNMKRISRPGRRRYVGRDRVPVVLGGMGVSILSTSQGVMTGAEAKNRGIGGEVLCQVW